MLGWEICAVSRHSNAALLLTAKAELGSSAPGDPREPTGGWIICTKDKAI